MNENQNIVLEKQNRRYQLLVELWKAAEGKEYQQVDFMEVAETIGYEREESVEIYHYLTNEDFFDRRIPLWGISLSHRAVIEIESSLVNPERATEHFSTTVIQNFNASVGAVQTGNSNVANVSQKIGQNFSEILEQLALLRNQFQSSSAVDKEEAIDIIDDFEKEVVKETPNKSKIKGFLVATKDFAVKTGTDLAASTLAKLLEKQMGIS